MLRTRPSSITGIEFSAFAAATAIIASLFLGQLIGWWRALWISVIGRALFWLSSRSALQH